MIDPNNHEEITALEPGEAAFPEIPYQGLPDLFNPSPTLVGMYNLLQNQGLGDYLLDIGWIQNPNVQQQNVLLNNIYDQITELVAEYLMHNNQNLLEKIFILIHLWGGITGRVPFVINGGFINNFDPNIYAQGIDELQNDNLHDALVTMLGLQMIGGSFASKHIHFWSQGSYPILDRVISSIVFGVNPPINGHYPALYHEYLEELNIVMLDQQGTTYATIERNLYNWAKKQDGIIWKNIRFQNL